MAFKLARTWDVQPSEFWQMSPTEFWWEYDARARQRKMSEPGLGGASKFEWEEARKRFKKRKQARDNAVS